MRRASLLILAAFVLAGLSPTMQAAPEATPSSTQAPAGPHATSEPVKKELAAVIDGQLAAFRANDFAKAYTFAAAEIRGMFPAADFEKMVKAGYPVIARSVSSEYGVAFDTGEEAVVNVRVQTAEKQNIEYQYLLKKEASGWKISGVSEVKAEGLSV